MKPECHCTPVNSDTTFSRFLSLFLNQNKYCHPLTGKARCAICHKEIYPPHFSPSNKFLLDDLPDDIAAFVAGIPCYIYSAILGFDYFCALALFAATVCLSHVIRKGILCWHYISTPWELEDESIDRAFEYSDQKSYYRFSWEHTIPASIVCSILLLV